MKKLVPLLIAAVMLFSCAAPDRTIQSTSGGTPATQSAPTAADPGIVLLDGDSFACRVVTALTPSSTVRDAARSLRDRLGQKTPKGNPAPMTTEKEEPQQGTVDIYVGPTDSEVSKELYASLKPDEVGYLIRDGAAAVGALSEDLVSEACELFIGELLPSGIVRGELRIPSEAKVLRTSSKGIPRLPDYPEGELSGPFDGGDGFWVFNYTDAGEKSFDSYIDLLEAEGFTRHGENAVGENRFADLVKDDLQVHLSYFAGRETVRIAAGTGTEYPALPTDSRYLPPVSLSMLGTRQFGLSMVITLSDGRFIVIDGGQQSESSDLCRWLVSETPDGQTPTVAAWFFTHAHPDHTYAFYGFDQGYYNSVDVESFVFNFPSLNMYKTYEPDCIAQTANVRKTISSRYPDAAIIKPHTGNVMEFGGVTVEFLMTQDDLLPRGFNDFNDSSMVMKFDLGEDTLMVTGDMSSAEFGFLNSVYEAEDLDCDLFQMPHHGSNNDMLFYKSISPKICLLPDNDLRSAQKVFVDPVMKLISDGALAVYASQSTVTLSLPLNYEELPDGMSR